MAQEESIEFLTLHSATHSIGIKAKDACGLVMHPDDAKKLLDQLLEGKDDVMRLYT